MRLTRVLDNKPCYQIEKKIQNVFLKHSGIKFLSLKSEELDNYNKVFYFNKIYTLEKNLERLKNNNIKFYIDLDIIISKDGANYLNGLDDYIPVGNIYYINWEYTNLLHLKKIFPKEYYRAILDLVKTHKRYSTMLIPINILDEFFEFLNKINYKELVKKYYNQYLEEFLYSIFIHKKRLDYLKNYDKELVYNLYLRKIDMLNVKENDNFYGVTYYHLTTDGILSYFDKFVQRYPEYEKEKNKLKKLIQELSMTKKYKKIKKRS